MKKSLISLSLLFLLAWSQASWAGTAALAPIAGNGADPCSRLAKTPVPFSFSTATTTQLVAASTNFKVYICAGELITAAANNVALVESSVAACASSITGMSGGNTAATGWNFAANSGIARGNGLGTVWQTAAVNRYVCLINSAATQTSGSINYVLAP